MAGRESGPAKKKVKTFRGEHRSTKWEENAERIFSFWADFRPDTTNDFLKIGMSCENPVLSSCEAQPARISGSSRSA